MIYEGEYYLDCPPYISPYKVPETFYNNYDIAALRSFNGFLKHNLQHAELKTERPDFRSVIMFAPLLAPFSSYGANPTTSIFEIFYKLPVALKHGGNSPVYTFGHETRFTRAAIARSLINHAHIFRRLAEDKIEVIKPINERGWGSAEVKLCNAVNGHLDIEQSEHRFLSRFTDKYYNDPETGVISSTVLRSVYLLELATLRNGETALDLRTLVTALNWKGHLLDQPPSRDPTLLYEKVFDITENRWHKFLIAHGDKPEIKKIFDAFIETLHLDQPVTSGELENSSSL